MGLTTDPNDPDLKVVKSDSQQAVYLVLSDEERAKGFVRPLRRTYKHVGLEGPKNELRDLTDEQKERGEKFGYVKYEAYPEPDGAVVGKYWTQQELDAIGKGCQTTTTMGQAIAETYARDPGFYGGTFCCHCGKHLRVAEFIWIDDGTRVGS